jgi:DNA-binding NarL/FixJ family response regulator
MPKLKEWSRKKYYGLTPRLAEILQLMADGMSEEDISKKLGLAETACSVYVARAKRRLGYKTTFQLMYELGRSGIWVGTQGLRP